MATALNRNSRTGPGRRFSAVRTSSPFGADVVQWAASWLRGLGGYTLVTHIHPEHHASIAGREAAGMRPSEVMVDGEQLARDGWSIAILDLDGTGAERLAEEIAGSTSVHAIGIATDIVEAAGQTYHFRRESFWGNDEELVLGDTRVGSVRKTNFWRGDVAVELPGLATALQLFVLGVVISMWHARAAAAAAGG